MERKKAKVISTANQKGGVGKTSSTDNIGEIAADQLNLKTLLIDMDPQSSLTSLKANIVSIIANKQKNMTDVMLQRATMKEIIIPLRKNLYLAPTTLELSDAEINLVSATLRELVFAKALEEIIYDYDLIIIDCPPSRGLLTVNALSASDYVVIPVQSEYQALIGINLLKNTIKNIQKQINPNLETLGYFITMITRTNHSSDVTNEIKKDKDISVILGSINRGIAVSEAGVANMSVYEYDSSETVSKQYLELTKTIVEKAGVM
ncbi:AAA family ATPase [Listeria booriae]|uniref:Sporulation initiation inhibitor protein Soj n=2 Tax=Listeria booriae TaxID=1552123 RepID=A0A842EW17_9LIST|nr:AAA family ATPase [Listeria booriae]